MSRRRSSAPPPADPPPSPVAPLRLRVELRLDHRPVINASAVAGIMQWSEPADIRAFAARLMRAASVLERHKDLGEIPLATPCSSCHDWFELP